MRGGTARGTGPEGWWGPAAGTGAGPRVRLLLGTQGDTGGELGGRGVRLGRGAPARIPVSERRARAAGRMAEVSVPAPLNGRQGPDKDRPRLCEEPGRSLPRGREGGSSVWPGRRCSREERRSLKIVSESPLKRGGRRSAAALSFRAGRRWASGQVGTRHSAAQHFSKKRSRQLLKDN